VSWWQVQQHDAVKEGAQVSLCVGGGAVGIACSTCSRGSSRSEFGAAAAAVGLFLLVYSLSVSGSYLGLMLLLQGVWGWPVLLPVPVTSCYCSTCNVSAQGHPSFIEMQANVH
jgi:hypothetical protein